MLTVPQIDEAYRTLVRSKHDPGQAAIIIVDLLQADSGAAFTNKLRSDLERLLTEGCSYARIEKAFTMIQTNGGSV